MSKQTDVAGDAKEMVGQTLHWAPDHGALYEWANPEKNAEPLSHNILGLSADHAINCYSFPVLLAIRRGFLDRQAVRRLLVGIMDNRGALQASAFSTALTATLWQDWKAMGDWWRPRPGDLVFFEAHVGGLLNHVAISTGKISMLGHSEVVSFGERLMKAQAARINLTSIELLRQEGHTSVKFLTPSWD